MEVIERARRYLAKIESPRRAANDSQDSHSVVFGAAVALVKGFSFPDHVAKDLLIEFCSRSDEPWTDREINHKISQAGRASSEDGYLLGNDRRRVTDEEWKRYQSQTRAAEPEKLKKRQEVDEAALRRMVVRGEVGERFLLERSPVDVGALAGPEEFLGTLYQEGEKVLVFTSERSQGDFGFEVARGENFPGRSFRLASRPGGKAEAAPLPRSGRLGVWMLANPVTGKWAANGGLDRDKKPMLSRRSAPNVTSWRYLLLESDSVDPAVWLNVVVQMPLPVAAAYTSGGRSVHALVRLDARTQDDLRQATEWIGPVMAKLGADPGALSSVRLTRLAMCFREGKMRKDGGYEKFPEPMEQRLLWLDPEPEAVAILTKPKIRDLSA